MLKKLSFKIVFVEVRKMNYCQIVSCYHLCPCFIHDELPSAYEEQLFAQEQSFECNQIQQKKCVVVRIASFHKENMIVKNQK